MKQLARSSSYFRHGWLNLFNVTKRHLHNPICLPNDTDRLRRSASTTNTNRLDVYTELLDNAGLKEIQKACNLNKTLLAPRLITNKNSLEQKYPQRLESDAIEESLKDAKADRDSKRSIY